MKNFLPLGLLALLLLRPTCAPAQAPPIPSQPVPISSLDRQRALAMLTALHQALHQHYYDLDFHGVDIDKRYQLYTERLSAAPTLGDAFLIIAAYLSGLRDSHTYFIPPPRSWGFDYGFRMQMIGDRAFITGLRPGSDAAAKLHRGDEILRLNGYSVTRSDFHDLSYSLYLLAPVGSINFELRNPQGATRATTILTRFLPGQKIGSLMDLINGPMQAQAEMRLERERSLLAGDVFVWKLPEFDGNEPQMYSFLDKARQRPAIVLDLRGNPGGQMDMLRDLLGAFLPASLKIADVQGRKQHQKPLLPSVHGAPYAGKLIVLVDGDSASAAEIFARAIQLAHRGTVVGDQSAGAVMEARIFPFQLGVDLLTPYAASITADDLIMADGHSLEGVGVTPDVVLLPAAADLASSRDPVLAEAVTLAGGTLDPTAAARAFPIEWLPLDISR